MSGLANKSVTSLILFVWLSIVGLTGCDQVTDAKAAAVNTKANSETLVPFSSAEGTFLVKGDRIWKFDPKEAIFLEVPVSSKLRFYNPSTGKIEDQKPCDQKNDPLCIR